LNAETINFVSLVESHLMGMDIYAIVEVALMKGVLIIMKIKFLDVITANIFIL
jgi:hypothetical protein